MNSPALEPRRDLTLVHATSLVVGVIIGTGIFLKAASMAQAVGTPGLVLAAWVAAGLVAMLGALCFAELGAVLPHAGGEYVYLRTAYGEIPGFLFACNAFVLGGAAVAAYGAAVAIFVSDIHRFDAVFIRHTLHLFGRAWNLEFGARQLIAVGVIAVFAAINCLGVMLGGRVQTLLTATKVAAIVLVAGGVFLFSGGGTWANLGGAGAGAGAGSGGLAGFGGAMFAALWAYSGWQFLPMAAGEVREPQRTLPRAIVGGTLLVLALYLAVNTAYLYALPFWQVTSANSTAYPDAPSVAARAVETFLGTRAAPIAALIFLVSTIGSLNGVILSAARVPYAAARDGLFFAPFGRLNPRSRVPVTSLVLLAVWGALLAASGTFDQLTNMAVMSYALFWIPVSLAVLVLRRKLPDAPRSFRVPGYPLVPLVFALVMVWIVASALLTATAESVATLVLVALGLPLYPLFRRRARGALTATRAPTE
ncbi:MAG TPA: amino acid permease [Steroidobacteraceae bacterium]|nr:amino acid permease [Gammaproteobacteria bacterium]HEV2286508.1 amino acid permease [Steroidobacteraceae bacterium]